MSETRLPVRLTKLKNPFVRVVAFAVTDRIGEGEGELSEDKFLSAMAAAFPHQEADKSLPLGSYGALNRIIFKLEREDEKRIDQMMTALARTAGVQTIPAARQVAREVKNSVRTADSVLVVRTTLEEIGRSALEKATVSK